MFTRFSVAFRFVVIVAALLVPVPAMSQSFYGSLVAVVEDPQGGVMPGATIVLVNTATNERVPVAMSANFRMLFDKRAHEIASRLAAGVVWIAPRECCFGCGLIATTARRQEDDGWKQVVTLERRQQRG